MCALMQAGTAASTAGVSVIECDERAFSARDELNAGSLAETVCVYACVCV